jgi:hypothetical protein
MATYASYKKLVSDNITNETFVDSHFAAGSPLAYGVQWFFGQPCACSTGCCCLWTVPTGVRRLHIEMWGAGGGGHGQCSCGRCHHFKGAGGGYYNSKTIATSAGCQYTVCAAGNGLCCRQECVGCNGCTSYVNGYNLSNFCALGGMPGCGETSWGEKCYGAWQCCLAPGNNGGDFGMGTQDPAFGGVEFIYNVGRCHCYNQAIFTGSAPLIGTYSGQSLRECWIRCGCWTVPYGHGGQGAMGTYCGSGACGQGGMGGPGLVRITYF